MARMLRDEGSTVYEGAEQFIESCLRRDDSLFTPGQPIWSARAAQELQTRFVERPDESGDTFMEKLQRQLEGATPEATQLLAEMLFVYFLLADSVRGPKKRSTINEVLSWLPQPVTIPDDLASVLDHGICHAGMSFNAHRPFFLWQLVAFVQRWKALTEQERESFLRDPFAFKRLVYRDDVSKAAGQRDALLHIVHPDSFESIYSAAHKRKIAAGFADRIEEETEDVDEQILQIRRSIEEEDPDFWSFYRPPYLEQWKEDGKSTRRVAPRVPSADPQQVVESLLPDPVIRDQVLQALALSLEYAHAQNADCWSVTLGKRKVRLNVGPLASFDIKPQGIGISVLGDSSRQAIDATSGATFDPEPFRTISNAYMIQVDPHAFRAAWPLVESAHRSLISRASSGRANWARSHAPAFIDYLANVVGRELPSRPRTGAGTDSGSGETRPLETLSLADVEDELFLEDGALEKVVELLEHKRQVVFHGPPGTGKTFIARRLARYLAAEAGRVELVQFHPSYAYEDFVEGFRPRPTATGQPGFELVPGPLKRIAADARVKPEATFVLIIDEMNRGNLAKIFGELYFLLEYRDEEIALQYSTEPFRLPPNLLIIGTMNTADRSIALVDMALRRRFHFAPFFPDRRPIAGVLRRWLAANTDGLQWIADVVDHANALIEDRHVAIGPSHFLRDDLDEDGVAMIWEHSILPYVEEQFFGQEDRISAFDLEKLRKTVTKPAALGDSPAGAPDAPGDGQGFEG